MIVSTLFSIAIFQGIVIGFILLRSPLFKSKTNQYLAFAIFALSWSLLNLELYNSKVYEHYPFLKIVDIIDSASLFPVLILFFVIHQVNYPQEKTKRLHWLFLPFILSVLHSILEEIASIVSGNLIDATSVILGAVIFLILFLFLPFVLTKTYQYIRHSKRKEEKKWLIYLWSFEVIFLGAWLLAILLSPLIEYELSGIMPIIALFVTLLIHWVAYSGVYQLKLASDQEKIRTLIASPIPQAKQGAEPPLSLPKTEITEGQVLLPKENVYYQKLEKLCSEQKIYRDSTLDRNTVAQMLDISPSYVSQIINSITGDNFTTYINRYRIEDVKILILDQEFNNYSLLAIGLECGFSSKTTFYNSFKKFTGMTPNAYRKTHQ